MQSRGTSQKTLLEEQMFALRGKEFADLTLQTLETWGMSMILACYTKNRGNITTTSISEEARKSRLHNVLYKKDFYQPFKSYKIE